MQLVDKFVDRDKVGKDKRCQILKNYKGKNDRRKQVFIGTGESIAIRVSGVIPPKHLRCSEDAWHDTFEVRI